MHTKIKTILVASVFAVLLVAGCATAPHAKVPRSEAERIALAQVPNGVIKEGELEREHGRLIWSFDISTPGTKDITEVHVDANTGKIISSEKETEAQEKSEKKHEK